MEQVVRQAARATLVSGSLMVVSSRERELLHSFRLLQEREQASILRFAEVLQPASGPTRAQGAGHQIDQA